MKVFLQVLILFLASVQLLMSYLMIHRLPLPTTPGRWIVKVLISAISPFLFLSGVLTVMLGWAVHSWQAVAIAAFGALICFVHVIRITRPMDTATGFESVFGRQWEERIAAERKTRFLPRRFVLRLPSVPDPVFTPNLTFHTIPGDDRKLLCDIWQPPENTRPSGLAFIYLHGSAWVGWDKDRGTRTFFRRLASQGHVIMDVAYRLFPEADFMGMVHDVKHALAWMKAGAAAYGVDPERLVIGGGSAGAHIAMLAAYTYGDKQFLPADLEGVDLGVRGVVSLYGPSDLEIHYYHTGVPQMASRAAQGPQKEANPAGMPAWLKKKMGEDYHRLGFDKDVGRGTIDHLLGGRPDEIPEVYALFSPVSHIREGCPPTLLILGEHDIIVAVKDFRQLYARLTEAGVPAVMHLLPQADHAFDLILPKTSPSAHNAHYDVERFLALMV